MFCTNCGKKMPDGSSKCPSCGKEVKNSEINLQDVANFASDKAKQMAAGASQKTQESIEAYKKEQEDRNVKNVSDIIVDQNEEQISVLGGGYLANMLHGGGLSKGFGILSDKRFYFKGKCYTKSAGVYKSVTEEYIVDLEDITATGFTSKGSFWLIILAIIAFVLAVISLVYDGYINEFLVFAVPGIILLAIYRFTLKNYYEISFAGGSICVDASKYGGMKEVRGFNKALRLAKDKCK